MKRFILLLTFVMTMALLFCAGCTQPPVTPTATPTPTPTATPVPTTIPATTTSPVTLPTSGLGTPGPTQALPSQYSMDFQINTNGDTANPMIQVSLRGGNGFNTNSLVNVSLTTPDGRVQEKSMIPPFYMGQNVTFPCSTFQNHVEIWVTAPQVGKIKVDDEIVPFKQLNP